MPARVLLFPEVPVSRFITPSLGGDNRGPERRPDRQLCLDCTTQPKGKSRTRRKTVQTTHADLLPPHIRQTLADFENQEAKDQAEIETIQEKIRIRREAKYRIIQLYAPIFSDLANPENAYRTDASGQCPLTQERMRELGTRIRILATIATLSPDYKVRPLLAARWMSDAGIFETPPDNAAKSIARYMRRHPELWEPQERGWFRFLGMPDPQTELTGGATQEEPLHTDTDQEEHNGNVQYEPESTSTDDTSSLSQTHGAG